MAGDGVGGRHRGDALVDQPHVLPRQGRLRVDDDEHLGHGGTDVPEFGTFPYIHVHFHRWGGAHMTEPPLLYEPELSVGWGLGLSWRFGRPWAQSSPSTPRA